LKIRTPLLAGEFGKISSSAATAYVADHSSANSMIMRVILVAPLYKSVRHRIMWRFWLYVIFKSRVRGSFGRKADEMILYYQLGQSLIPCAMLLS
jgi:hypothetical protein